MAEGQAGTGIRVDIPIGRFDPATAGKYEERPSLFPAMIEAYQMGTNLVENAWQNQYKYQLAQLNLQAAQSRLTYQDQYNDILKQQYDQQNQLFPTQLEQARQQTRQNQMALDQQNWNLQQDRDAQAQVPDALAAINDLRKNHIEDLDFHDKVADLKAKYATALNRPATVGSLAGPLNDLYDARTRSGIDKVEDSQIAALEHAQQVDHILPSNINVPHMVRTPGGAEQLTRMANQQVLTDRAQTILQNSQPGTDSYRWATEMLGALRNQDQSQANQLFDAHGMVNDGVQQSLRRWEIATGVPQPKTGGVVADVEETYDDKGKLTKRIVKSKNQDLSGYLNENNSTSNQKRVLPDKGTDITKDPDFQRLRTQIPAELQGPQASDAQRKAWMYGAYLRAKGIQPGGQTGQQQTAATTGQQAQGFVNPNVTPTPAPTPPPARRGRAGAPAQPTPEPTPPLRVRQARAPTQPRVIPPAGERRRRPVAYPPGTAGYEEGGVVQPTGLEHQLGSIATLHQRSRAVGGFQQGGVVPQPGGTVAPADIQNIAQISAQDLAAQGASTDTVSANLTPGEYVVNQQAAEDFGYANLDQINQMAEEPRTQAPSIAVNQTDPFTAAFLRARQATEGLSAEQLLQQPQQEAMLPYPRMQQQIPGYQAEAPAGTRMQPANYGTQEVGGNPSLRALAYGPHSEGATAADMRQTRGAFVDRLQNGDIAVSPNLLGRYPPLSRVNVVDRSGNVVFRDMRVADKSYYSEDNPTTDTFEVYNGPSLGSGYHLVPVNYGG